MPTKSDLKQRQALPLDAKVQMSKIRIREWYNHFDGDVYISFSGGKDSTVLAHLVHDLYPNVPLVFSNTGLEYPEIQSFARKMGAEFVRPKMMFSEVISKYGYPIISKDVSQVIAGARRFRNEKGSEKKGRKREFASNSTYRRAQLIGEEVFKGSVYEKTKWMPLCQETQFLMSAECCRVMKKEPLYKYQKEKNLVPYVGTLAEESKSRENEWMRTGCNAFEDKKPKSQPMSVWTEQDVLHYIKREHVEISSVYGELVAIDNNGFGYEPLPLVDCKLKCTGCQRTGCIFCAYGCHLEKGETRFQRLAKTHPKQYEYCMRGGNG